MKKFALLTLVALLAATGTARATEITYSLDMSNCCSPSPFGTVTLNDFGSSGSVQITVSLNDPNGFVLTGFDGTFGFNITGDPTISVSGLNSGWSLLSTTAATGQNIKFDGFGLFEYAVVCDVCQGGSNPYYSDLVFTVSASGLTVDSFAELSTNPPGDRQGYFAADIIDGSGATGIVSASGSTVPDGGATVTLLGSALFAFALLRRRLGKN